MYNIYNLTRTGRETGQAQHRNWHRAKAGQAQDQQEGHRTGTARGSGAGIGTQDRDREAPYMTPTTHKLRTTTANNQHTQPPLHNQCWLLEQIICW